MNSATQVSLNPNLWRMPRVQLVVALVLSGCITLAIVVALNGSTANAASASISTTALLLFAVSLTALASVALVWSTKAATKADLEKMRADNAQLNRQLAMTETIMLAEPQILIFWEHDTRAQVVTHSLSGIAGVPSELDTLLHFGTWLDSKSAGNLKSELDALFTGGRAFNTILRTAKGGHVEADGRAAAGRAVLRIRDVAGYKRDISRIIDQHQNLARDIRTSRALLNALPSPVWLKDKQARINWVNAAYVEAVEAASEREVIDRQMELLEKRQRESMVQALESGERYHEHLGLIIGGERKTHDVISVRLDDGSASVALDVAALETAQGELDRQVTAFDRTLDRVATAVAIFSDDGRLVFFNDAYRKLWQLDDDWLQGAPKNAAILDKLRDLGRLPEVVNYRAWKEKFLNQTADADDDDEPEDWWHLPDGRIVHVVTSIRPDGGVTHLYVDETERLALESRYNEMIRVQGETLNSLGEGVAVFATDGRIQLHNSAFTRIWDISQRTLAERPHISKIVSEARDLYDNADDWNAISRAVTSFSVERAPVEGQMIRPDQSVIDFATTPLPDGGTLLTFADVTDSKRYERVLKDRNEALVIADRLKSQFIGHVSYELRAPLTNIIGFSELLESPHAGPLTTRQRDYLDDIATSSKTLLSIIDDILDLATIDAGVLELKLAPVPVLGVINEAILGVRERAARAGLTLDIAIADDAETLVADEARLRQVLYNLLSNAIGFSKPDSTIHLTCWRENAEMVFQVDDQGVGIPKEEQERITDRFVSKTHGSQHRGAGLGLSLVNSIVELHGGSISLDSEPGRGTRITVRLPEDGSGAIVNEPVGHEKDANESGNSRVTHAGPAA